jgi:hypothetical protein
MTATTEKAAEAWENMVRPESVLTREFGGGPMPPAIGLDMVQETGCDRDDAVSAILQAAEAWLTARLPDASDVNWAEGGWVCLHIGAESFHLAEVFIGHVADRCLEAREYFILTSYAHGHDEYSAALPWQKWVVIATRALTICRAVCAAAHPA